MVEARYAAVIAGYGLAVDDAGAGAQTGQRLDDEREAACEVIARPAVLQLHPCAVLAGDDAESIVFDCVQPHAAYPPGRLHRAVPSHQNGHAAFRNIAGLG